MSISPNKQWGDTTLRSEKQKIRDWLINDCPKVPPHSYVLSLPGPEIICLKQLKASGKITQDTMLYCWEQDPDLFLRMNSELNKNFTKVHRFLGKLHNLSHLPAYTPIVTLANLDTCNHLDLQTIKFISHLAVHWRPNSELWLTLTGRCPSNCIIQLLKHARDKFPQEDSPELTVLQNTTRSVLKWILPPNTQIEERRYCDTAPMITYKCRIEKPEIMYSAAASKLSYLLEVANSIDRINKQL